MALLLSLSAFLKKLNKNMPKLTAMPTHSLFSGSCRDFYLTREQKSATRMTESMLQDLTMTTAGKEAAWMALL